MKKKTKATKTKKKLSELPKSNKITLAQNIVNLINSFANTHLIYFDWRDKCDYAANYCLYIETNEIVSLKHAEHLISQLDKVIRFYSAFLQLKKKYPKHIEEIYMDSFSTCIAFIATGPHLIMQIGTTLSEGNKIKILKTVKDIVAQAEKKREEIEVVMASLNVAVDPEDYYDFIDATKAIKKRAV